jgi:hypothetical protein
MLDFADAMIDLLRRGRTTSLRARAIPFRRRPAFSI